MRKLLGLSCLLTFTVVTAEPAAWQISHPEHSGEILILGSIHLLRESDYPLPPIVDELYARSDQVIFEIDLDDLNPAQMQTEFLGAAMLAPGKTLADVIDPTLYAATKSKATEYGVDLSLLAPFEPWFVAINLLTYGLSDLGYQSSFGIEQYILRKAVSDGKNVIGIETMSEQIEVFDSLTETEQTAVLEQTLAELARSEMVMNRMVTAWREGQLAALESEILGDFTGFPELYERLLVDRNINWANDLESFIASGNSYVMIVGALHLVGEHSVPTLLRQRGYTVDKISTAE